MSEANDVDVLVMRCPVCGYTQQDAETHLDHHLCSNPNPPWRKYFRSQAIPGDPETRSLVLLV